MLEICNELEYTNRLGHGGSSMYCYRVILEQVGSKTETNYWATQESAQKDIAKRAFSEHLGANRLFVIHWEWGRVDYSDKGECYQRENDDVTEGTAVNEEDKNAL